MALNITQLINGGNSCDRTFQNLSNFKKHFNNFHVSELVNAAQKITDTSSKKKIEIINCEKDVLQNDKLPADKDDSIANEHVEPNK